MNKKESAKDRPVVRGFTIDNANTRLRDDGFSIEKRPDGSWRVAISMTDVASLVPKDSDIDRAAQREAMQGRYRFLPDDIAYDIASLEKGRECPAITIFVTLDDRMKIVDYEIKRTTFIAEKQYTYPQHFKSKDPQHEEWRELAKALLCKRQKEQNKALRNAFHKAGFVTDLANECQQTTASPNIIEELVYLSRHIVGDYFAKNNMHGFYTLEKPVFSVQDKHRNAYSGDIEGELDMALERGKSATRLAVEASTPLRRYDNLVMQRVLVAALEGERRPYNINELRRLKSICRWFGVERMSIALSAKQAMKGAHKSGSDVLPHTPYDNIPNLSEDFQKAVQGTSYGVMPGKISIDATRQNLNASVIFNRASGEIMGVGVSENYDRAKNMAFQAVLDNLKQPKPKLP